MYFQPFVRTCGVSSSSMSCKTTTLFRLCRCCSKCDVLLWDISPYVRSLFSHARYQLTLRRTFVPARCQSESSAAKKRRRVHNELTRHRTTVGSLRVLRCLFQHYRGEQQVFVRRGGVARSTARSNLRPYPSGWFDELLLAERCFISIVLQRSRLFDVRRRILHSLRRCRRLRNGVVPDSFPLFFFCPTTAAGQPWEDTNENPKRR